MEYLVIKIFDKETDELVKVRVATKETLKYQLKDIDYEKYSYFCIKCNVNKMQHLLAKYQ